MCGANVIKVIMMQGNNPKILEISPKGTRFAKVTYLFMLLVYSACNAIALTKRFYTLRNFYGK